MGFTKIAAVIVSLCAALSTAACNKADTTAKNDGRAVFTVGDTVMTETEFMGYVSNYTMYGYPMDMAKEAAKQEAINNLTLNALVTEFSAEEEQAMKAQKEQIIEAQGGEDGYKELLESLGTEDVFIDNLIRSQAASEKLFAAELTDDVIKAYFNDNYYRAKHVLLATMDTATQTPYDDAKIAEQKNLADDILSRAKNGEDFDAMVSEYSEDPGSKSQPDGYYFTDGEMVTEFQDTTKALGMNEYGLCESTYGYHVIKRLPLDDNEELYNQKFEELKPTIKGKLTQSLLGEKLPELLKEKGLEVKTNEDVYNSIKDEQ